MPPAMLKHLCWPRAERVLKQWNCGFDWKNRFSGSLKKFAISASTSRPGVWVDLSMVESKLLVRRISDNLIVSLSFVGKDCARTLASTVIQAQPETGFSNHKLRQVLQTSAQSKSRGIIYVWSPKMPLSERGLAEVKAWTKSKGITLVEVGELESKNQPNSLTSSDLVRRGLALHYPSMIFFSHGRLVGQSIPGYKNEVALNHLAKMEAL